MDAKEKKSEDGKEEEPREEVKILISLMKPMLTEIKPNTTHIFSVPENDLETFQMAFETLKMDLMMPIVYREQNIHLVAVRVEKDDDLKDIPTCDLVNELSKREGVEEICLSPDAHTEMAMFEKYGEKELPTIERDGPSRILIVID